MGSERKRNDTRFKTVGREGGRGRGKRGKNEEKTGKYIFYFISRFTCIHSRQSTYYMINLAGKKLSFRRQRRRQFLPKLAKKRSSRTTVNGAGQNSLARAGTFFEEFCPTIMSFRLKLTFSLSPAGVEFAQNRCAEKRNHKEVNLGPCRYKYTCNAHNFKRYKSTVAL